MKYVAVIDADEKPVCCEFIGCNGNVTPYLIGSTTDIRSLEEDKPHIKGDYYDGFRNGLRTAKWRYDKIRAEIKAKIEEEEFARSVFRHEEKDTVKAEQCTGSIMAYNNLIKLIDKYRTESEE